MREKNRIKTFINLIVLVGVIPLVVFLCVKSLIDGKFAIVTMVVALLSCVPFFVHFERGKARARELVVLSVMIAISVVSRLIFAPIPAFKPVSAIIIITGIAFGMEAGFLTGSMSALCSNIFFGQGVWTPFQMVAWGMIGLISGIVFKRESKPNLILLILVGIFGGVFFSLLMDVWTTFSIDGVFNFSRYIFFVTASVPFMVCYAVSNVIFLLILTKPFLSKLSRLKQKFGLFDYTNFNGKTALELNDN